MHDTESTIVALATAKTAAVRGIIRISGPRARDVLSRIFRPLDASHSLEGGRSRVIVGSVDAGSNLGDVPADVYFWPDERSYTRQPAAEIHTVGSPPVLDAILTSLVQAGARLAAPGEFTMRAFLSGRLDLTQAEAVLGVIDASSDAELQVALNQLAGGVAKPLHRLREQLLELLAHLEAGLDFVEEDIEFITLDALLVQLDESARAVRRLLEQLSGRHDSVVDPRLVLRGLPNTGKSSLFNALVGDDRSIVSDMASTTRDFVTAALPLSSGRTAVVIDTAGVESVERSGSIVGAAQRHAEQQARQAELEIFCIDSTRPLTAWETAQLQQPSDGRRIVVLTKCDQPSDLVWQSPSEETVRTSSHSGEGLEALRAAIARQLDATAHLDASVVQTTAARCRESLMFAAESLERARANAVERLGEELVAAEVRLALHELGTVAGVIYTDDILDRVFSRFCIGK